jgi:hypothetical protein
MKREDKIEAILWLIYAFGAIAIIGFITHGFK